MNISRLINNIKMQVKNNYDNYIYYKAVFFLLLSSILLFANLFLIGFYAYFNETTFVLIHVFTVGFIFVSAYLVIIGHLNIGSGLFLYYIYILLIAGLYNTEGIDSFLLPVFVVLLSYMYYFRDIREAIMISAVTIIFLIFDVVFSISQNINVPFNGREIMINNFGIISYSTSIVLMVLFIFYYGKTTSSLIGRKKENETKFSNLFNKMGNGFSYNKIILDDYGNIEDIQIVFINEAFSMIFKKPKEDIEGKMLSEVFSGVDMVFIREVGNICFHGKDIIIERYVKSISKWVYIYAYTFEKGYFASILHDITEVKNKEHKIENTLRESEVLVKEMNHRVRNNLQVISSLLNLVSGQIKDDKIRAKFIKNKERVMSMSLVHENLYRSRDFSRINFKDYLLELIDRIFRNYRLIDKVNLFVYMKNILVDLNTAVHLGLLINEIICRSLEFRKFNKAMEFSYYMRKYKINNIEMYSIIIHDNWEDRYKYSLEKGNEELELIKVLSEQIDADLNIEETDISTIYKIDFAVED